MTDYSELLEKLRKSDALCQEAADAIESKHKWGLRAYAAVSGIAGFFLNARHLTDDEIRGDPEKALWDLSHAIYETIDERDAKIKLLEIRISKLERCVKPYADLILNWKEGEPYKSKDVVVDPVDVHMAKNVLEGK